MLLSKILGTFIYDTRMAYVPKEQFLWPYSAPYSPFSPYSQSFFILLFSCEKHHNFMIGVIDYYCRGCRVHCRVTKIVSLVHRPTLVSYINVPSIIVRSKQSLEAPKSQISLSGIFFETPGTMVYHGRQTNCCWLKSWSLIHGLSYLPDHIRRT